MLRASLFALAAIVMTAGAAQANVIYTGTASLTDSTSGNNVDFSASTANVNLTTLQNAGDNLTLVDFMTLHTTFSGTALQTDNLSIGFTFTSPSSQSVTLSGTGTEQKSGSLFIGGLSFTTPELISFSDGAILKIALALSNSPSPFSATSSSLGVGVNATFTLQQAAQAVPVPASLALFGSGLLGFLALRRRQTPDMFPAA